MERLEELAREKVEYWSDEEVRRRRTILAAVGFPPDGDSRAALAKALAKAAAKRHPDIVEDLGLEALDPEAGEPLRIKEFPVR